MAGASRAISLQGCLLLLAPLFALIGCSGTSPSATKPAAPGSTPPLTLPTPLPERNLPRVMLGIDVLEAEGFTAVKGKRLGLLTHPAGVNRRGVSTLEVLRRAADVQLVALFAPEHGIHGDLPATAPVANTVDRRTGLPVFSLYNGTRKPTREMLKGIDALVIDLQDIGTRSYTFVSAMKRALEGCFENNVEVIVLDRPNPLGGWKVDGPPLDAQWAKDNYVGAFRVPYVHGLTIGELARMAKEAPSLDLPDTVRTRGRLTVIPMRGWTRAMRWPDTGLPWTATSGAIQDWAAVQGYPMVGLGSYFDPNAKVDIGFRSGVGAAHIFRGLSHTNKSIKLETLEKELRALNVAGVQFRRIRAADKAGRPAVGIYIEIVDYDAWRPAELNFHLLKLACKLEAKNPFAPAPGRDFTGFLRHMGSSAFLADLAAKGARIDLDAWVRTWREQAAIYQEQSKRYWLYRG